MLGKAQPDNRTIHDPAYLGMTQVLDAWENGRTKKRGKKKENRGDSFKED